MPWKNTVSVERSLRGEGIGSWAATAATLIRSWAATAATLRRPLHFLSLPFAAVLLTVVACTREPLKNVQDAMRPTANPTLDDDLPLEPLFSAIDEEIRYFEAVPGRDRFVFGARVVPKTEYIAALRKFVALGRSAASREEFFRFVEKEFEFFEVYGQKRWGDGFFTSYYEPVITGALKPTPKLSQPLYGQPNDIVELDLAAFDEKYNLDRKLRGRLVEKKFVPYFSREDIDSRQALKGRNLELCWVDPIDAFVMQIQGSGTIDLGAGRRMRLGYADKNGHRYEAVSNFLTNIIPKEQMSLQAIETHLRTLPEPDLKRLLNLNPSYVFFRVLETLPGPHKSSIDLAYPRGVVLRNAADARPPTYLGLPATDGRTIATDPHFFPKGAIAFLVARKPRFLSDNEIIPSKWQPFRRFVLDQDIGGAITGGGRADIFWGQGPDAKRSAGVMKEWGQLYYLVPKPISSRPGAG